MNHTNDNHNNKNAEGYSDPTARDAVKNADAGYTRMRKLLDLIFAMCDLAGYHVEGRIELKDKETGKIWK